MSSYLKNLNKFVPNPLTHKVHTCSILNFQALGRTENRLKAGVAIGGLFISLSEIFVDLKAESFVFV